MSYSDFIARKLCIVPPTGLAKFDPLPDSLLDFAKALTGWALRRGRAAIFADTGLTKTRMGLVWANEVCKATGGKVLILAPLAVGAQTAREGELIGIPVTHCRDGSEIQSGINITNYDRLHRFTPSEFTGVVLDESSCIKHHDTKTLAHLLTAFAHTPFKLCETATPAPNDWSELGTHAEFLGICTRAEMLSEFFLHDSAETQLWRLKKHAAVQFWKWVASWGAMVRKPSDLGFDDSRFTLPDLLVHEHTVSVETSGGDLLFALEAATMSERRNARRASLEKRVAECAAIVNASDAPWVIWCDLNDESDALVKAIPGAVEVRGAMDADRKEQILIDFAEGRITKLVTKASITGWGLNWQFCNHTAFVGVTDSFEAYYQAIRRFWRFGQKLPVHVHIFASELEGAIVANLKRKETDAQEMSEQLTAETAMAVREQIFGATRATNIYKPETRIVAPSWLTSEAA